MRRKGALSLLAVAVTACGNNSEPAPQPRTLPEWIEALVADHAAERREAATRLADLYPGAARAIPMLVDVGNEDDDPSVRAAATKTLTALGREAVAEYERFLERADAVTRSRIPKVGERFLRLGPAVSPIDLAKAMASTRPAGERRDGAAWSISVSGSPVSGQMEQVLIGGLDDPDAAVRRMCAAALGVLGWSAAATQNPATANDLGKLLQFMEGESERGTWETSRAAVAGCVVRRLLPRRQWPTADSPFALGPPPAPDASELPRLIARLNTLAEADRGDRKANSERAAVIRQLREHGESAKAAGKLIATALGRERDGWKRIAIARTLIAVSPRHRRAVATFVAKMVAPTLQGRVVLALLDDLDADAAPAAAAVIEVLSWPAEPDDETGTAADRCVARESAFALARLAKGSAANVLAQCGTAARPAIPQLRALTKHADPLLRSRATRALRRLE